MAWLENNRRYRQKNETQLSQNAVEYVRNLGGLEFCLLPFSRDALQSSKHPSKWHVVPDSVTNPKAGFCNSSMSFGTTKQTPEQKEQGAQFQIKAAKKKRMNLETSCRSSMQANDLIESPRTWGSLFSLKTSIPTFVNWVSSKHKQPTNLENWGSIQNTFESPPLTTVFCFRISKQ